MTNLFPTQEFTPAEQDIIHNHLTDPLMVKYFTYLGHKTATQILQMYCQDEKETKFLRDIASMQGQLMLLNTLLNTTGK